MTEEKFIQKEIIDNAELLKNQPSHLLTLVFCAQMIETLGAFIDKKPFACPQQSRKRFDESINLLFPEVYQTLNRKSFLYHKFRSHLLHYFQLHKQYSLTEDKAKHGKWKEEYILLHPESFLNDIQSAAKKVIDGYEQNRWKRKKVGSPSMDFGE
jgi:hypothetical protein